MEEKRILDYLNYLLIKGYDEKTSRHKAGEAKKFLSFIKKDINQITETDINQYYLQLQNLPSRRSGKPLKASTLAHKILAIEYFFDMLLVLGKIPVKPITSYTLPKDDETYEREILSQTEIEKLYALADETDTIMLDLAYGCGLRAQELVDANRSDIYLKEEILIVPKGKFSKRRIIPLTHEITKHLGNYFGKHNHKGPEIIINSHGTRMQKYTFNKRLKKLLRKIGLPEERIKNVSLHSLRHSIATHLLENGMEVEKVQEFLGHNHLETTEVYTRISMEQLKKLQHDDP
jgi:integrase/recombinase XerD